MTRGSVGARQSAPGKAQLLPRVRARRHLERHGSGRCRHVDTRAEHRFPWRERQIHVEIEALGAVQRMRLHLDVEIEIAVAAAVRTLAALAGNAQLLPVGHTLRHADADLARHASQDAVFIGLRHRHVELDLGSLVRLVEREANRRLEVLPRHRRIRRTAPAARAAREAREEIGEIDVVERKRRFAGRLLPAWRWPEFIARRVTTKLVVRGALLGVLQRFVCFGHFLELFLGARFLRDVGMVFARELAIRGLDLRGLRRARNAERRVVVLVFHRARLLHCSLMLPSNEIWMLSPETTSVMCAGKLSVPLIVPSSMPCRTARSMSRCEPMPTTFRNLRMLRLNVSSFMARFSGGGWRV